MLPAMEVEDFAKACFKLMQKFEMRMIWDDTRLYRAAYDVPEEGYEAVGICQRLMLYEWFGRLASDGDVMREVGCWS